MRTQACRALHPLALEADDRAHGKREEQPYYGGYVAILNDKYLFHEARSQNSIAGIISPLRPAQSGFALMFYQKARDPVVRQVSCFLRFVLPGGYGRSQLALQ
jgi:hypothetical protein